MTSKVKKNIFYKNIFINFCHFFIFEKFIKKKEL